MGIKLHRPITPSLRYITTPTFEEVTKKKPEKSLLVIKKKTGGRNSYGRVTARGIGGGHKQKIRKVDFKRANHRVIGEVVGIEYDPIRSARLALIQYKDGSKAYILAPKGLNVGAKVTSGPDAPAELGNSLPLSRIPVGSSIHNLELTPGKGGQIVRAAGGEATLMSRDAGYAQVKLPSGEIRKINEICYATIGQVGNTDHENTSMGKAGNARHRGVRPITRGVAKNPHDHPMGGGAGKTAGGGHPVSPWGVLAKGFKTRPKRKKSNKFILVRRDGRPMKLK